MGLGRWKGVGRCQQSEPVGSRTGLAQTEGKWESTPPHPAGSEVGRVRRNTGEGGARVRSRWVGRVRGKEVQGQGQVQMENLKNRREDVSTRSCNCAFLIQCSFLC